MSFGEILSTLICSAYLNENNLENKWLDVRRCIRTNSDYRRARIDWEKTCENINAEVDTSGVTVISRVLLRHSEEKGQITQQEYLPIA